MVEIHFKTFSPLAAPSSWVVITAQSAPIWVVRSQVVRRGAVIRGVLSVQRSACHSSPQAAGSAGEWPATTAAPATAGASTQLLSLCAHPFRVVQHRLLRLALRRRHVPFRPRRQVLTLRPPLLRYLARARDSSTGQICMASGSVPDAFSVHRMVPAGAERHGAGRSRDRVSGSERVKRPTTTRRRATSLLSTPLLTRRSLPGWNH